MSMRITAVMGNNRITVDSHQTPNVQQKKKQPEVIIAQRMRVWWLGSSGQHDANDGWSEELKFSKVYANKRWHRRKRQRIADWNLIVSPQEEKLQANITLSALEEKLITAISRFLELYDLSLFISCDIKRTTDVVEKCVRSNIINWK